LLYDQVWKFDIKNIHPKYIKVYTDINPTVDFVFPVNKIDRENSEKMLTGILLPVHFYLFGI
jgi:hypothetical protein